MRELKLWEDEGGVSLTFTDIEELGATCRFTDCRHEKEVGCTVLQAVANGEIEGKRLSNYRKTLRELKFQAQKEAKSRNAQGKRVSQGQGTRKKGLMWLQQAED
jgi:ribosome biogenesis GTPase